MLIVTADGVSSELVNVDPVHYKLAQSVGSGLIELKNQGKKCQLWKVGNCRVGKLVNRSIDFWPLTVEDRERRERERGSGV